MSSIKRWLVIRCAKHPTYTGLSKTHGNCPACQVIERMRGATTPAHEHGTDKFHKVAWGA